MTHRSSRRSRPTTTAPQGVPDPTMPADVETLQAQLRLSRPQCAYLHRELATALKQGQPATALAHKVTVQLNALRDRLGVA